MFYKIQLSIFVVCRHLVNTYKIIYSKFTMKTASKHLDVQIASNPSVCLYKWSLVYYTVSRTPYEYATNSRDETCRCKTCILRFKIELNTIRIVLNCKHLHAL
jgi:hypothetical protein